MGWSGRKSGSVFAAGLRSIWRILFWAALCGVVVLAYDSVLQPTMYESTAEIFISDAAAGGTQTAAAGSGSAPMADVADSYTASYIEVMTSNKALKRIRKRLDSNMEPSQFAKYYTVEQVDNTAVFRIKGQYKDAASALLLTRAAARSAVKTLEEVGVQASIVDNGTMSQRPVSPFLLLHVLLAFAAGFIIRFILAMVGAARDHTLRGRKDWEDNFDIPVLAEIPERDA